MRETYQPPTTHVIPAKTGIPPAVSKPSKRRTSPRLLQNSTKPDKILRKLVCAHTRARGNSVPFLPLGMDWIRRIALELPSHSHHANKSNGTNTRSHSARVRRMGTFGG